MAQEIEIEYKNSLTKEEFDRLLQHYPFPDQGKTQTNYYFETKDFALQKQGCALRIREKAGQYVLTLKEPHPSGLLETHDVLTEQEAVDWKNGNIIAKAYTTKQLEQRNISPTDLVYYGSLTTERREVAYHNVLLVLDYSTYNGMHDYEFELEAPSEGLGLQMFQTILQECAIPNRDTPNKIRRFFTSLQE